MSSTFEYYTTHSCLYDRKDFYCSNLFGYNVTSLVLFHPIWQPGDNFISRKKIYLSTIPDALRLRESAIWPPFAYRFSNSLWHPLSLSPNLSLPWQSLLLLILSTLISASAYVPPIEFSLVAGAHAPLLFGGSTTLGVLLFIYLVQDFKVFAEARTTCYCSVMEPAILLFGHYVALGTM